MEDVKERDGKRFNWETDKGFNPCFNGRCKRTSSSINFSNTINKVSILVLMEDVKEQNNPDGNIETFESFNPCFNGRCKRTSMQYLAKCQSQKGFNPCFNGRCKRTNTFRCSRKTAELSFNPCFNGSCKRTQFKRVYAVHAKKVSILVLMEVVKEH